MKCEICGLIHRVSDRSCPHQESQNVGWSKAVRYAFEAVLDSAKLTLHDQLILHALGVAWV
jgi:hypothetical protein